MASLSRTNTHFQTLVSTGPDGLSNLFKVKIIGGGLDDEDSVNATIRCSGFRQPSLAVGQYEVRYLTAKIMRPNAKVIGEKKFSLTFRLDANYSLYKAFLANQKKFSNFSQNAYNFDIDASPTYTVQVCALDNSTENEIPLFEYKRCWVESITPPSYSSDASQAAQITVNFRFVDPADRMVL